MDQNLIHETIRKFTTTTKNALLIIKLYNNVYVDEKCAQLDIW
jgi:hypothetical protein